LARTHYGASYWLDRFPSSRRRSYPRHRGSLEVEVAVVGGGALGCATAYVLAAAGIDVAVFEQGRLAHAEAGRGTGIVLHELEPFFHALAKQHGVRDARHLYQIARRGSLEYVSALKRLRIECGLRIRDAVHFSSSPEGMHELEKEFRARREAGIDVASLKGTPLYRRTGENGFGLLTHGNASVDPYRAAIGLARAAAARGAKIFEQSPVTRVRPRRKTVDITTAGGGTVTASKVVIATGYPTDDFKPLRRRFTRSDAYVVLTAELPASLRRDMPSPDLILRDAAAPDHWMHWIGNRVMFAGADQPSVPDRARERALIQRTGQLMYELSVMRPAISGLMPEYSWDVGTSRTIDGVPYYGPHRNYPHHYFAFSGGTGGLGLSFAAARIILRHYQGAPDKGDEPFSFTRIRE
jgi:glycine/D-amino acid oxidase-like deaminating enzyme